MQAMPPLTAPPATMSHSPAFHPTRPSRPHSAFLSKLHQPPIVPCSTLLSPRNTNPKSPLDHLNPQNNAKSSEDFFLQTRDNSTHTHSDQESAKTPSPRGKISEIRWMMAEEKTNKSIPCEERDTVVEWVAKVHTKYRFSQDVLHRAVQLIDNYLSSSEGSSCDYEKLAVTAFWMSSKIEDTKVKHVKHWAKLGRGFAIDQILAMEEEILYTVGMELIHPTSQMFQREFLGNFVLIDPKSQALCLYLLELALVRRSFCKYKASILALSSLYVAFKVRRMNLKYLDDQLEGFLTDNLQEVRKCSKLLCRTLQQASTLKTCPIYRKFLSHKFIKISSIKVGKKEVFEG